MVCNVTRGIGDYYNEVPITALYIVADDFKVQLRESENYEYRRPTA